MSETGADNNSSSGGPKSLQHPSEGAIRQIVRQAINASPLLDEIVEGWQSYQHWGINE